MAPIVGIVKKIRKYRLGARRTLLWAAVGWLLAQFGLAAAIELALPEARDPQYAVRERRLLARMAGDQRPLWLMLGSSRTQLGWQAARLAESSDRGGPLAFNFGMPGCGPLMQMICFDRLLARNVRPQLLLIELTPALLASNDGQPMEERLLDGARLTIPELVRALPYYRQPRRLLGKWAWSWLAPCQRRAAELRRLANLGPAGQDADAADYLMDDFGWQHVPAPVDAQRRRELTRLAASQYDGALARFQPGTMQRRALEELLVRCRQESIPAVLVMLPIGSSFERLYGPPSEPALQRLLAELRRDHGVEAIDARHWVDDEFFSDGHHLLPAGAIVFTDRLARETSLARIAATASQTSRR